MANLSSAQVADVLEGAAGYIDTKGWIHGQEGYNGSNRCGIGAVKSVLVAKGLSEDLAKDINQLFESVTGVRVEHFNDSLCRVDQGAGMAGMLRKVAQYVRLKEEAEASKQWMANLGRGIAQAAALQAKRTRQLNNLLNGLVLAVAYAQTDADMAAERSELAFSRRAVSVVDPGDEEKPEGEGTESEDLVPALGRTL